MGFKDAQSDWPHTAWQELREQTKHDDPKVLFIKQETNTGWYDFKIAKNIPLHLKETRIVIRKTKTAHRKLCYEKLIGRMKVIFWNSFFEVSYCRKLYVSLFYQGFCFTRCLNRY